MKTKAQKEEIVKSILANLEKQKATVFVDFAGLKVKELLGFRKQLKQVGAIVQVMKKTLLQRALSAANISLDAKQLKGEVAAIFAFEDSAGPMKSAYQFAKTNERLKVIAGYFEKTFYGAAALQEIANLPSKEQLFGRLVGTIASPLSGFMNVLQGNMKGLIRVLAQAKTS